MTRRLKLWLFVAFNASRWRWFRRWCGGHWERRMILPPINATAWLPVHWCGERFILESRPLECEDWPGRALSVANQVVAQRRRKR